VVGACAREAGHIRRPVRRHGDVAGVPFVLQGVEEREVRVDAAHGAHDPAVARQREQVGQLGVLGVAVDDVDPLLRPARERERIEVDAEDLGPAGAEAVDDARAVAAEPEHDHVGRSLGRLIGVGARHPALEHVESRAQSRGDRVDMGVDVHRDRDRQQRHGREQRRRVLVEMADVQAERTEDERELADLPGREPRLERDTLPVAESAQQAHHDERLDDDDERRENDGDPQLPRELAEVDPRAEVDEEEEAGSRGASRAERPRRRGTGWRRSRRRRGTRRPRSRGRARRRRLPALPPRRSRRAREDRGIWRAGGRAASGRTASAARGRPAVPRPSAGHRGARTRWTRRPCRSPSRRSSRRSRRGPGRSARRRRGGRGGPRAPAGR
jgi:hypothetical protein